MKAWTSRKTPLGEIVPVTGVNGETFIWVSGGRPLSNRAFGLSPAKAREAAAALIAAADEIDAAPLQDSLWEPA